MDRVVLGMDPHTRSAAIEVMAGDETVLGGGRYGTDRDGYEAMLYPGHERGDCPCSAVQRTGSGLQNGNQERQGLLRAHVRESRRSAVGAEHLVLVLDLEPLDGHRMAFCPTSESCVLGHLRQ